jgi:hypothetical protein
MFFRCLDRPRHRWSSRGVYAQQSTPTRQVAVGAPNIRDGRFQIFFGPFARADVYMLDTQTGRVWRPVTYKDLEGEPEVWQFQPRIDSRDELVQWVQTQTVKK